MAHGEPYASSAEVLTSKKEVFQKCKGAFADKSNISADILASSLQVAASNTNPRSINTLCTAWLLPHEGGDEDGEGEEAAMEDLAHGGPWQSPSMQS